MSGLLDEPETYDAFIEEGCPTCGADVGVAGVFGFCDDGHLLVMEKVEQ